MDEFESQIAKIQLGNFRHTSSYVYVVAEKATGSDAELYVVAELPLLNPAALESCQQICRSVAGSVKRSYRKPLNAGSFENAIAQTNEELGKLASLGQVHWINKLNCIIAVRSGRDLAVATCGKVAAFLLRNGEFADISCSPSHSHPLKTFENYSSGRLKLNDLIILSTNQLFNYLAMDRLRDVLTSSDFLAATQTIVELLKENAGPDAAFGTLMNLLVPAGQAAEGEIEPEGITGGSYGGALASVKKSLTAARSYASALLALPQRKRVPQTALPAVPKSRPEIWKKLSRMALGLRPQAGKLKLTWRQAWNRCRQALDWSAFSKMSGEKKIFLISLALLLAAVIFSLAAAAQVRGRRNRDATAAQTLNQARQQTTNAESALLLNDERQAAEYLNQAKQLLPPEQDIGSANQEEYRQTAEAIRDLERKLQKIKEVDPQTLGTLGAGANLIGLADFWAVQTAGGIVSYNRSNGRTEDGALKAPLPVVDAVMLGKTAIAYAGGSLRIWNPAGGNFSQPFSQSVPQAEDAAGLAAYPTNSRVYLANKKNGQVISYLVSGGQISRPVISVSDPELKNAADLAVDGAIYALTASGIYKYQSGRLAEFNLGILAEPLSGQGKLYTQKDYRHLYLLDSGTNRLIILDKQGRLQHTLTSPQFTKLVDFYVDEPGRSAYLLNDATLLRVDLP